MNAELLQTSALVQVLLQYLSQTWSIVELEDWLVGNLQDILSSGDHKTIEIANQVDALLVDKSEGLINEDQFKKSVSELVSEQSLLSVANTSGSNNKIISSEQLLAPSIIVRARHSFVQAEAGK